MNEPKRLLPEERELERLRLELESRVSLLADRELDVANTKSRLAVFERLYLERIGALYVRLDELEAQLAEVLATQFPSDRSRTDAAESSRERAEASQQEYTQKTTELGHTAKQQEATLELRSLYRKMAKRYHPDFALDPQEKQHRSEIMTQVNEAFAHGDYDGLLKLSEELEMMPEAVSGDGTGAELVRVIRKIAQIDVRLAAIDEELETLKHSELCRMADQYEEYRQQGRDLLDMLAADLKRRIAEVEDQLSLWRVDGHDKRPRGVPAPA